MSHNPEKEMTERFMQLPQGEQDAISAALVRQNAKQAREQMNQQTNSDHVAGIKERLRTFPLFFLNGSRWMQSTQIEPICLDAADYIEQLEGSKRDVERLDVFERMNREASPHTPYYENGAWRIPYLINGAGGLGGGVAEMVCATFREAIDAQSGINPKS